MFTNGLWVMQDGFRLSKSEMIAMRTFVNLGGFFNEDALLEYDPNHHSLIALVSTPDGKLHVRDGLHRVYVINRANRPLRADEYTIENKTYEEFMKINFDCGWVTPFDPRREVRKSNFFNFKNDIIAIDRCITDEKLKIKCRSILDLYIYHNKTMYSVESKPMTVLEFAAKKGMETT